MTGSLQGGRWKGEIWDSEERHRWEGMYRRAYEGCRETKEFFTNGRVTPTGLLTFAKNKKGKKNLWKEVE